MGVTIDVQKWGEAFTDVSTYEDVYSRVRHTLHNSNILAWVSLFLIFFIHLSLPGIAFSWVVLFLCCVLNIFSFGQVVETLLLISKII